MDVQKWEDGESKVVNKRFCTHLGFHDQLNPNTIDAVWCQLQGREVEDHWRVLLELGLYIKSKNGCPWILLSIFCNIALAFYPSNAQVSIEIHTAVFKSFSNFILPYFLEFLRSFRLTFWYMHLSEMKINFVKKTLFHFILPIDHFYDSIWGLGKQNESLCNQVNHGLRFKDQIDVSKLTFDHESRGRNRGMTWVKTRCSFSNLVETCEMTTQLLGEKIRQNCLTRFTYIHHHFIRQSSDNSQLWVHIILLEGQTLS